MRTALSYVALSLLIGSSSVAITACGDDGDKGKGSEAGGDGDGAGGGDGDGANGGDGEGAGGGDGDGAGGGDGDGAGDGDGDGDGALADAGSDAEVPNVPTLNALAEGPWHLSGNMSCGFSWSDGATGIPDPQNTTDFTLELAWNPGVGSSPVLKCKMDGGNFTCESFSGVAMVGNCAITGNLTDISGTVHIFQEEPEDELAIRVASIGGKYSRSSSGTNNPPCATVYPACAEASVTASGTIGVKIGVGGGGEE